MEVNVTKTLFRILAVGVLVVAGESLSAELPLKGSFKIGTGPQMGGLRDTTARAFQVFGIGELEYALSDSASVVGELGWRYLPGMERVAAAFQNQNVSVATTNPAYYKYATGQVLRAELYNVHASGWLLGALYRQQLPMGFYAQGGVRASFLRTRHEVMGSLMTAGTAPASATASTPLVSIVDLGRMDERKTMSPSLVGGLGFNFLKRHAVELNLSTASVDTDRFGKKSGALVDITYRMKF
jgi:hypothetical protein